LPDPSGFAVVNDRILFYKKVVGSWLTNTRSRVLVVGAEENDQEVFQSQGFGDVTLLNLGGGPPSLPAGWSFVRASGDCLPFPDDSFDYVIAHATLHHCRRPHAVLLEMYRVASKRAVFIEARDSLTMRALERTGVTQVYETTAVHFNDGERGGVDDTSVPNFIYRWTEREVEKTVCAYAPHHDLRFEYLYGLAMPQTPAAIKNSRVVRAVACVGRPLIRLFMSLSPRQQNLFAACICKPGEQDRLKPWLCRTDDGRVTFDRAWGHRRFHAKL
jgi:SAM-dependent methyltransferase